MKEINHIGLEPNHVINSIELAHTKNTHLNLSLNSSYRAKDTFLSSDKGLEINNLTTGYQKKNVIDELSIPNLPKGKITALLGPNGCGKSTLLRALAGLNKASGRLLLQKEGFMDAFIVDENNAYESRAQDLMAMSFKERANHVVYMPQSIPEGIHLPVFESILVAQKACQESVGFGKDTNAKEACCIMKMLEKLGISHLAWTYLNALSGGQKQLVALAQSLIRVPSVLLLDEPLSALDLNYQFHVMNLVKKETQARELITVVVVHDINIALQHADHVVMLKEGRLVASGAPIDVITPKNLALVYGVQARVERCSKNMHKVMIDGLMNVDADFL